MTISRVPFVVISGPPGSGKSTLATALSVELELPLISKDKIKEALLTVLSVADSASSQELGRASMAVLFQLARDSAVGAVLEANFRRSKSIEQLQALNGRVVEIHCRCDRSVALDRYRSRQETRHSGHFDALRSEAELWDIDMVGPLAGDWAVVEVDTNIQVDASATARAVRELLSVP